MMVSRLSSLLVVKNHFQAAHACPDVVGHEDGIPKELLALMVQRQKLLTTHPRRSMLETKS